MKKNSLMFDRPIRLRWYDSQLHRYFVAGIGFYNGSFGDYTLKINLGRGKVYLRPVSYEDGQTRFRVEEVRQDNGKVIKQTVGTGFTDESTGDSIHIKIGGYSDLLILG